MPRGDGTGPAGMGPMTGRAAGYCAGYPVPGYANPGFFGGGYGRFAPFAGSAPFAGAMTPYAYGAGRAFAWRRPFGRTFGGAFGRAFGRGLGWGARGRRFGR